MNIREQIAKLVFYPDVRVSGGLLVNAHEVIDMAEARERELLAERQAFISLLKDMVESDSLMGRITDEQVCLATAMCEDQP